MNEEYTVGVGPHKKPWPHDNRYDPELLENGDRRNVLDKYRYWSVEAIKADLDASRSSLHIAIENWQHDLNIGTIVRTANAFNVETVHIIGKRHWNRRGAMVTDRYMNIVHHDCVEAFYQVMVKQQREIIGVDILPDAEPLNKVHLDSHITLVFGGEGPGLSQEMKEIVSNIIMIPQAGSTRSMNVGVAAGITMYIWTVQNSLTR